MASSFIQSDDEDALLELIKEPSTSALGLVRIAPTVLISHAGPKETAQVLRTLGLSPAVEEPESTLIRLRRTTAVPGSGRPVYSAPRTAPPEADVDAQLAILRSQKAPHGASGNGSHHAPAPTGEEVTQLGLETLQKAIRLRQPVTMNVVDSQGNASRETVVPVSVTGGRVRVFDPARETERVLSIHRIIDIEAEEEFQQ
jgi:hypothetical protein